MKLRYASRDYTCHKTFRGLETTQPWARLTGTLSERVITSGAVTRMAGKNEATKFTIPRRGAKISARRL